MSLTQQVIALLRVATEPQSTGQLREQLEAMGVINAGDVNKRIFALCDRGVVSRVGSGRDTRYQLVQGETLDQMEARSNARAAAVTHLGRGRGRKDGAPTFRDHLLKLIEGTPGITCAAITAALTAAGVPMSEVLGGGGERNRKFDLDELEQYIDKYHDVTPIQYLIAKYMPDQVHTQAAAMASLALLAESLPSLLAQAGMQTKAKKKKHG